MSTTTRFSSRVAAAFITDRRALATRPPRPITRPRSSSATSTSRTTSPSTSSASVTWTCSGFSTSDLVRKSSRSRIGQLGTGRLDALGPEQGGDGPGRTRPLLQPVLGAILVDHDQRRVGLWVVLADRLDRAAVPRRALVGDDNPPDRVLLGPDPAKSDSHGHAAAEVSGYRMFRISAAGSGIFPSDICFISLFIWPNCLTRRLTAWT